MVPGGQSVDRQRGMRRPSGFEVETKTGDHMVGTLSAVFIG